VSVPTDGSNGHKVRPDGQTKRVLGASFVAIMGLMGFLALQVWNLNGAMRTAEANDRAQEKSLERQERALDRMSDEIKAMRSEFREAIEGLRAEIRGK